MTCVGGAYVRGRGPASPHQTAASHAELPGTPAAGGAVQDAAETVVEGVPLSQAVEVALVGRWVQEELLGRGASEFQRAPCQAPPAATTASGRCDPEPQPEAHMQAEAEPGLARGVLPPAPGTLWQASWAASMHSLCDLTLGRPCMLPIADIVTLLHSFFIPQTLDEHLLFSTGQGPIKKSPGLTESHVACVCCWPSLGLSFPLCLAHRPVALIPDPPA